MTPNEFDTFLKAAVIACAVMGVGNLFLYRKRGLSAYVMSLAALVAGGCILVYQQQGLSTGVYTGVGLLFVLLVLDFILRAGRQSPRNPQ